MMGNIKTNKFEHPFRSQYVRVIIEQWQYGPCLRFELYGCSNSTVPTEPPTTPATTVTTVTTPCPGFVCDNGQCISNRLVCDGKFDCEDASDEKNCKGTCR